MRIIARTFSRGIYFQVNFFLCNRSPRPLVASVLLASLVAVSGSNPSALIDLFSDLSPARKKLAYRASCPVIETNQFNELTFACDNPDNEIKLISRFGRNAVLLVGTKNRARR